MGEHQGDPKNACAGPVGTLAASRVSTITTALPRNPLRVNAWPSWFISLVAAAAVGSGAFIASPVATMPRHDRQPPRHSRADEGAGGTG